MTQKTFQPDSFIGIGFSLVAAGVLGIAFFLFGFDTSIATPPNPLAASIKFPERVNNIGLLDVQQSGIIVSCFVAMGGLNMFLAGWLAKRQDIERIEQRASAEASTR